MSSTNVAGWSGWIGPRSGLRFLSFRLPRSLWLFILTTYFRRRRPSGLSNQLCMESPGLIISLVLRHPRTTHWCNFTTVFVGQPRFSTLALFCDFDTMPHTSLHGPFGRLSGYRLYAIAGVMFEPTGSYILFILPGIRFESRIYIVSHVWYTL